MSKRKENKYNKKEHKKKNGKKPRILALTTVAMLLLVALCSLFAWYQLGTLEEGILDVCATQQDAYVQLVLDQINLKNNRNDEEIINEILNTLDSSTNKYWTFSKDKDMLFVKDVIETNRYKGLTTVSYFDSKSARDFMGSLKVDQVIHKNIVINGKEYIASGVSFQYGKENYRLCLLTNKSVILDSNRFMIAKVEFIILVCFMMIVMLAVTLILARKLEISGKEIIEQKESIGELQKSIGQLNELLNQREQYDTRYQVWNRDVIEKFLKKFKTKGIRRVVIARIHCKEKEQKNSFLEKASVLIDKKVLRFALNDTDILLMCVQYSVEELRYSLELLLRHGVELESMEEFLFDTMDINGYIQKLEEKM